MKFRYLLAGTWVVFLGLMSLPRTAAASFVVIVNTANPTTAMSRKFLSDAFLKKVTFWEDGESIVPVDLDSESEVRRAFSEQILKRPIAAVRSYWQQMIFSGQAIQPLELDSEEQVIRYVASHPNALAYISVGSIKSSKVRTISWR